jgi:hypothetical protein
MKKSHTLLLLGGGAAVLYFLSQQNANAASGAGTTSSGGGGSRGIINSNGSGATNYPNISNNSAGCYGGGTCSNTNIYGPPDYVPLGQNATPGGY